MVIVSDVDGCILDFNTAFHAFVTGKLPDPNIPLLDYTFIGWIKGITKENEWPTIEKMYESQLFSMIPPLGGVSRVLRKLSKKHTINLCTFSGRTEDQQRARIDNLVKMGVPFKDIRFVNDPKLKLGYCKEVGAKIIIEDSPANIIQLAKGMPNAIILVPSYEFNQHVENQAPNIKMIERDVENWWWRIGVEVDNAA